MKKGEKIKNIIEKMNKDYWGIFFLALAVIAIFLICISDQQFLRGKKREFWPNGLVEAKQAWRRDCPLIKSVKTIQGKSMEPFLKVGEQLTFLNDYYDCYEPRRNQVIAYDYSGGKNPSIKIIRAIPGDKISFSGGGMLINGEVLKNSLGQNYHFSSAERKMLSLYVNNGYLVDDGFFIFGDNVCCSIDSRKYGAVSKKDMLGKFDL